MVGLIIFRLKNMTFFISMQKTDDSWRKHEVATFRHKILLVTNVGNLVETILERASKDMLKIKLVIFVEF